MYVLNEEVVPVERKKDVRVFLGWRLMITPKLLAYPPTTGNTPAVGALITVAAFVRLEDVSFITGAPVLPISMSVISSSADAEFPVMLKLVTLLYPDGIAGSVCVKTSQDVGRFEGTKPTDEAPHDAPSADK
jgi:hypothetical protein